MARRRRRSSKRVVTTRSSSQISKVTTKRKASRRARRAAVMIMAGEQLFQFATLDRLLHMPLLTVRRLATRRRRASELSAARETVTGDTLHQCIRYEFEFFHCESPYDSSLIMYY
jgi:hypothetical protein